MKKIMFSKNKSKIYVGLFFSFLCGITGIGYVYATTFSERLSDVGIDTVSFSDKNSISRYEVARLLNAANCQDCVQAPEWMKQKYTQDYWNNFRAIDGKDFDDVDYGAGVWNKKSYYYCVAYIADNGYMAGYPSTSTKCKGSFCGQDSITTSEFYQTVLNIIQPQIRQRYLIDWSKVKAWKKGLKKNSIQMRVLNQSNIDVIDKAESKIAYAESNEEFQTWLKYCMYNLSECNFQSFGVIGTGYWPVSELNILYKEGIISLEDAQNVASFPNMKGSEAIRIFSAVYDNYSSCSFNVDYDCDGIVNGKDNCPYMYNPNQYDLDGDRIGNVCDDDIDGDGNKNPIGIVDDNNRIIISLWDDKSDITPMAGGDLGFSFFINVDAISSGFPTNVKFVPLTDGNISKIEWDFGDGTREVVDNGNKVNHIFGKSGFFTVKAVATSKSGTKSFAMTKVFITDSKTENYALNIKPSLVFKNGSVEYTFTPLSLGDLDEISWNVNDQGEVTKKLTETFKTTIKENGRYVVTAKGYKNGELKAIAMFTMLQSGSPKFISMDVKTGNLWEQSSVTSNLMGILREEIDHININWGGVSTDSSDTVQKYVYDEAGLKTIQHNIVLKDGTVLYNLATITVKNPLLSQSYAMNVVGDRLGYNQGDNLALGLTMYPKTPVMSLFTSYQVGQKRFIYNPDFSKLLLDFSYADAGDKLLTNSVEVNRCVALVNQGTVHINAVDICENAMKNKSLSKYKCDQDGDKIPDICDDDIDGDGVKNLVGIILYENKDCSIGENNINSDLLKKQLGVCSLDNCPFVVNPNQSDLNNNGIGEVCEDAISKLLSSSLSSDEGSATLVLDRDQDGDGVADGVDECIDIPGNSSNGCPEYYSQNCWVYSSCGNGVVDEGENCQNCPQDAGVCCGNGTLESWESCKTCPQDAGDCHLCGNGKINKGENCRNCEEDVGKCTAYCGNGEIEAAEDCRNCEKDVGKCSAYCGNGEIEAAEDCDNCSKDVELCRSRTCGNGVVDEGAGEECDSNKDKNGNDVKCTKMCTIYDENKPNCGNGKIDKGEDCDTCSVDLGEKCVAEGENGKLKTCGNKKIDKGENCKNCEEDVGKCTAYCGNGEIEAAEDCRNCEKDVGKCSAYCGNGEIEAAEDCDNCSKDVELCRSRTCGNGVVDEGAGEECDSNKDKNGNDVKCTKMCTIYDENKPNCGNGKIDKGEDCDTCSVDLGEKCVAEGENGKLKTCGNKRIDKGENCKNCEEDVGKCTAYCGNGEIEAAEDCRNCEKDVGKCSAYCGNEKIEKGEDCNNCSKDVKLCRSIVYGNGVVDERAGEECDSGKDKDGNDVECTKMGTIYDENKPNCGNGEIDKGEDCDMCPVDLGEKCVAGGEKAGNLCGDGILNGGEQCDFRDDTKANWGTQGCSNSCQKVDKDSGECNTMYDGMNLTRLINSSDLCGRGVLKDFSFNANKLQWTRLCVNDNTNLSVKCFAKKSGCGDGVIGNDEKCNNCPLDLRDICVTDGDYSEDENCKCGECPEKLKSICIDDGEDDDEENCKCGECPEKLKERCIKPDDVDTPDIIQSPDEPQIPEDDGWYVENDNCSACPCEYVDFSTELTKGDTVRAKLWDKSLSVFYRYSNSTALETFIDVEGFNGVISSISQVVGNKNDTNVSVSQDAGNGENKTSQADNSKQISQTPGSTSLDKSNAKVEPVIGKRGNEVVREYTTEVNSSDASLKINLNAVSQYQQAIGFNSPKYNYEESLYLDSAIFKKGLDLIKDNQNFTIKVSINAGKEYVLVVQNRVNNVVVRAIISESAISDFEKYCKSVLGIDLNSMFGGLLSESKNTGEEGNTNSQTDASKQTSQTPGSVSLAKSSTNSNIKITKQSDRVVRTYTTELSKTDSAMKIYLKEVEDYQTAIGFNAHNFYEQVLYLDSATFKKGLNLIKDNPDFTITIQKNDKKEYILAITNRGNNAVISTTIPQSVSAEFETYCKNILGMDLSGITKEQKTVDFMDMLDKVSNGRG